MACSMKDLLKPKNIRKVTEYDETGCGISYLAVPVDTIKNNYQNKDFQNEHQKKGFQTMTVGQLKDFLDNYDDDCEVVMLANDKHNPMTDSMHIQYAVGLEYHTGNVSIVLIPYGVAREDFDV